MSRRSKAACKAPAAYSARLHLFAGSSPDNFAQLHRLVLLLLSSSVH